ncbi:MAG: hypothetical protein E7667_04795 [Ruminococcaceae bacterium]|nr:hypothetical protein [Oscillospiraceae bacterium]
MKKTILRVVALTLIAVMACAMFVACGGPASNPEKAKEALEKNGYTVTVVDGQGVEGLDKMVTGIKIDLEDTENSGMITIFYFESKSAANDAWEDIEKTYGDEEEDVIVKKSGKMIYAGTEQAIKDAK